MVKEKNSILITRVIEALYKVLGRRTLDSFAIQMLKTTIEKLETKFQFFRSLEIDEEFFLEEKPKLTIDPLIDSIEPARLGEAIDTLIRVV